MQFSPKEKFKLPNSSFDIDKVLERIMARHEKAWTAGNGFSSVFSVSEKIARGVAGAVSY